MTEISGRAAVVTGAGNGLGRAVAMALAAEGASVVVADILADHGEATAQAIRSLGGEAIAVVCDVSDRASVRQLKEKANARFGPIRIGIPNAGATSFKAMNGLADEEIDWIVAVNFMGVMNFLQAFLPDMIAAGEGHIVASASVAGLIPDLVERHVPYSAAKAGVIGMMMNLRRELEGTGVQSTTFCVASVDGSMKELNSLYRPERFGGPFREEIVTPGSFRRGNARPPEDIAPLVIRAIRGDWPMLVSDPLYRAGFERYAATVREAFDRADEFFGGMER